MSFPLHRLHKEILPADFTVSLWQNKQFKQQKLIKARLRRIFTWNSYWLVAKFPYNIQKKSNINNRKSLDVKACIYYDFKGFLLYRLTK